MRVLEWGRWEWVVEGEGLAGKRGVGMGDRRRREGKGKGLVRQGVGTRIDEGDGGKMSVLGIDDGIW
ncbi:hypothetical protein ACH5RR_001050, partial [Cinchona calisaya]